MKKSQLLLLVPALLALAFYSALGRVGWTLPIAEIAAQHGFLMVSGLFGTLISLERTLILKHSGWLGIPLGSALSVLLLMLQHSQVGFALQLLAASGLALLYLKQWLQFREPYFLILVLSALAWAFSALVLFTGHSYAAASMWYLLFLLFTIVAERLELSRFIAAPKWARPLLFVILFVLFAVQALPFHWGTHYINGIFIAALAWWLIQFDIVKINLKKRGFFFYTGSTLFAGYIWLMLSAVLMAMPLFAPYHYDAVLHSFFIGFAMSMLFAHAPIIFPALLKLSIKPYHPVFYLPVWASHVLLLIRLYADYSLNWPLRKWIGLFQVTVLLLFFVIFAGYTLRCYVKVRNNNQLND